MKRFVLFGTLTTMLLTACNTENTPQAEPGGGSSAITMVAGKYQDTQVLINPTVVGFRNSIGSRRIGE